MLFNAWYLNYKQEQLEKQYLDEEAEIIDKSNFSSDEEIEKDDNYDQSFVDDNSYLTQNTACDMTSKYLESVKTTNNKQGIFKIPNLKPYYVEDVYSQMSPETHSDYEIVSY